MSEKIMGMLDFGVEEVKGVDAKLAILKFPYSWADEVEREEKMIEESKEQLLKQNEGKEMNHGVLDEDLKTRDTILDFGEEPVKDILVDAKLAILKFPYIWVDEVEREEKMIEEAKEQMFEQKEGKEMNHGVLDEDFKTRDTILDFGEEPVKDIDAKLDILKFSYNWATEVEEHERRVKEALSKTLKSEDNTEKNIQEANVKNGSKEKMTENLQKVILEDQAKRTEQIQNLLVEDKAQEKTEQHKTLLPEDKAQRADFLQGNEAQKTKQLQNHFLPGDKTQKTEQLQKLLPGDMAQKTEQLQKLLPEHKILEKKELPQNLPIDKAQEKSEQLQNFLPRDKAQKTTEQLQNFLPRDKAQKTTEQLQNFLPKDKAQGKTEQLQNIFQGDEAQTKMDSNFGNLPDPLNNKRLATDKNTEVYQYGRQPSGLQALIDDEVENEDHFIPRRLFLFRITKFKHEEERVIETSTKTLSAPNPTNDLPQTCVSQETMATVSTCSKKNLRRRIKNFFGFK